MSMGETTGGLPTWGPGETQTAGVGYVGVRVCLSVCLQDGGQSAPVSAVELQPQGLIHSDASNW